MYKFVAVGGVMLLAACSAHDVAKVSEYQSKIASVCNVAMSLIAVSPKIAPWIEGGCGAEASVAKLAMDPSSLDWLNGLMAKAKR